MQVQIRSKDLKLSETQKDYVQSKVDKLANYAERIRDESSEIRVEIELAKNIVAAGLADRCQVQLAYAIGVADPVSILVDTFDTGKVSEEELTEIVKKHFPIKPADIIKELDLRRPIYKKTAAYGHFGRELPEFSWEKTDKVEELKQYL